MVIDLHNNLRTLPWKLRNNKLHMTIYTYRYTYNNLTLLLTNNSK